MIENLDLDKLIGKVKGKEYDYFGRLLFDGEYLNEEKWKKENIKNILKMN